MLYLWLVPKILLRFWWGVCIFGGFRNLILVFGGFLEPDCISGGLSFTFGGSGMSVAVVKSSQVNTLPKAKSKTRSKQNKDMHKCRSVYSERGVPLPVLTSGGE